VQERPIQKKEKIMKQSKKSDIQTHYDFSKGTKGKYSKRYLHGSNIVQIDPDIAEIFSDSDSVNDALRSLLKIIQKNRKKFTKQTS
jgi:hypothetical protein